MYGAGSASIGIRATILRMMREKFNVDEEAFIMIRQGKQISRGAARDRIPVDRCVISRAQREDACRRLPPRIPAPNNRHRIILNARCTQKRNTVRSNRHLSAVDRELRALWHLARRETKRGQSARLTQGECVRRIQ